MREIIAVCRSTKRSRDRVAAVLDHYFWRIGDRTWRGRASNACLERAARDLRRAARRNTAVCIYEIRSAFESRAPIIRIGSRRAFSPDGLAPVSSHAAASPRWPPRPDRERHALAVLRIAVLFHDMGKATVLFQEKLRRALRPNAQPEADPVRHELHSAYAWDNLVGGLDDLALVERLRCLKSADIDGACRCAVEGLRKLRNRMGDGPLDLAFLKSGREGSVAHSVGMLVLTHHRLPDAGSDHLRLTASRHVRTDAELDGRSLEIACGPRFWHAPRWLSALRRATDELRPGAVLPGLDIALRASLMFADHLGSALKQAREGNCRNEHLANTQDGRPADTLDVHVERVLERATGCFDMLHRHRGRYPALAADEIPLGLLHPLPASEPFTWQIAAASAVRALCADREGGFFACLMAGTGTGKTRGAPTVLAAAAFSDARPERRYIRMTLALGLRALASQAARDYVADLNFSATDVAVLIGQPPVRFGDEEASDGSESALALPDWLRVERATGGAPPDGSEREPDWLRRLSHDSDRGLPMTLDLAIEHAGSRGRQARRLIASPIVVGTIDHLMGVAAPLGARFLFQAMRVLSADLILDEIDQYDPEDVAAIARLVYQTAAAGRRVIAMSATLTDDVAVALHAAYREGWRAHAAASGEADHVNVLCTGDSAASCRSNARGEGFAQVYAATRDAILEQLAMTRPRRRGRILPPCSDWQALVEQVDTSCRELHDVTATQTAELRVSIGFVRMTRIAHTAALAVQLPAGPRAGRLRLKICLHSQFPRLHRAFIERELKQALTRKGPEPDAGLSALCERTGVFAKARAQGCGEVEIVLIASPVIETGNDLDFDWAVIDPISFRAVVQAAGRVWRHRRYAGQEANVHILGRSAIAMQAGKLVRPGVETPPDADTLVARVTLDGFADRLFRDLAGDESFDPLDAGAVLRATGHAPLREKEAELRRAMLRIGGEDGTAPLGVYLRRSTARLNRRASASRKFRRSTTRDLLFFQDGESAENAVWMIDLAPGTRESRPLPALGRFLSVTDCPPEHLLFDNLHRAAWSAALDGEGVPVSSATLRSLTEVRVPDYGREAEPVMTYGDWTGLTRGKPKDLRLPFGKSDD